MATERIQRKYNKRHREFLDAAADVFAKKGYHGATTKNIADRLGITQGNLYYYFKSKDDALTQVCSGGTEGYLAKLQSIIEEDTSWAEKLKDAIEAHIAPVTSIPSYVLAFQRERRYLSVDAKKRVYSLINEYNQLFESLLIKGIESKEFQPGIDTKLQSLIIIHACNGAQVMLAHTPKGNILEISDALTKMFLNGIRAQC